jgi:hypothetical protein
MVATVTPVSPEMTAHLPSSIVPSCQRSQLMMRYGTVTLLVSRSFHCRIDF